MKLVLVMLASGPVAGTLVRGKPCVAGALAPGARWRSLSTDPDDVERALTHAPSIGRQNLTRESAR